MKPNERLLEAINDLDEDFITDALTQPQTTHRNRVRILVLAAALAACLTACGIHSLSVWYQEYFAGQSEGELNREQKNYLEENVAVVTPQTSEAAQGEPGLTIESALTDGIQIYMKLRVVAEEGVTLYADDDHVNACPGNDNFADQESQQDVITMDGHRVYNALRYLPVEDGDGLDNTMDYLVLGMLEGYWDPETGTEVPLELEGKTLHIVLEDFCQNISSENYETVVETQQILTGRWEFDLTVTADSLKTRELISAPVEASLRYLDMEAEEKTLCWEPVPVTYITARALSLDIGYDRPGIGGDFGQTIRAVMTDGTEVSLMAQWSGLTFIRYFPDTPVMIDRIDHLVLEDGTVIQAE